MTKSIPHNRLTIGDQEVTAVTEVIRSGYWSFGDKNLKLEEQLAKLFVRKFGVAVSSGSSALLLTLLHLKLRATDKVIIPAFSCVAIANAVLASGARPVVVDVEPGTWNLDIKKASEFIDDNVKAIIIVNTFGYPVNIPELRTLGVTIIEDCSHGFKFDSVSNTVNSDADFCVLSLYATKLLAGGEGGAILFNDKEAYENLTYMRDYTDKVPAR